MQRRTFVAGMAMGMVASHTAGAQQAASVWRIGFLGTTSPEVHGAFLDAFRAGLRARGYIEGKNVTLESRWAESDYQRLPVLAAELLRLNVDLILTHGTPGAQAAKKATSTVPIVVAVMGDPQATGVVQNLARPGSNLTGTTFFFPELNAKRIQILKEAVPNMKRIAVLLNDANPGNVVTFDAMAQTARSIGVEAIRVVAHSANDLEAAFTEMRKARADAVALYEDPLFLAEAPRLAALAERHRLPSIGFREYADAGGLLAFGVNFAEVWRRAADFVDRIFKGAKPADLPMAQASKFDMVVNLRTAKTLRLTIPQTVLIRADAVIE